MSESIDTELRDVLLEAMDSYCEGFVWWFLEQEDLIKGNTGIFRRGDVNEILPPKRLVEMYRNDQTNSGSISQ